MLSILIASYQIKFGIERRKEHNITEDTERYYKRQILEREIEADRQRAFDRTSSYRAFYLE